MADTIRTQTDLLANLFQDGQSPGAITAQDIRDLIVSLRANQGGGWSMHTDATYNADDGDNNKLAIADGVRTKLTIDNAGADTNTTYAPPDGAIWDTGTNTLLPTITGAAYDLRLTMYASYDSGASAHIDMELDIGGSIGTIYHVHELFAKGAGETNEMGWSLPIFTLGTFVANGGTIYITPEGSNVKIWDIKLMITQTFKPTT